jgi:hypothetical protein
MTSLGEHRFTVSGPLRGRLWTQRWCALGEVEAYVPQGAPPEGNQAKTIPNPVRSEHGWRRSERRTEVP